MGNVVGIAVSKLDLRYSLDNFGSIPENTNFGIKANVIKSILDSNDIQVPASSSTFISKSELGKMISDATYYISCWMTKNQVKKLKTKKVMFKEFE